MFFAKWEKFKETEGVTIMFLQIIWEVDYCKGDVVDQSKRKPKNIMNANINHDDSRTCGKKKIGSIKA